MLLRNITEVTLGSGNQINVEIEDLGITILTTVEYDASTIASKEITNSSDLVDVINDDYVRLVNPITLVELTKSQSLEIIAGGSLTGFLTLGEIGKLAFWKDDTTVLTSSNVFQDITSLNVGIGTTSPDTKLTIAGNIKLIGSTSGSTELRTQPIGQDIILNLPVNAGSEGQALFTDGIGNLDWRDIPLPNDDTCVGKIIQFSVGSDDNVVENEWLVNNGMDSGPTNEAPIIMPYKVKLIAITFSNRKSGVDQDIILCSVAEGDPSTPTVEELKWELRHCRFARKTNFTTDVILDAGDKLAVYIDDKGTSASRVTVNMFFKILEEISEESVENYSQHFSTNGGNTS